MDHSHQAESSIRASGLYKDGWLGLSAEIDFVDATEVSFDVFLPAVEDTAEAKPIVILAGTTFHTAEVPRGRRMLLGPFQLSAGHRLSIDCAEPEVKSDQDRRSLGLKLVAIIADGERLEPELAA